MNQIKAEIILDSKEEIGGNRITTFKLTFPRYILAELNTHRVFSKNSASSRAIPFNKMVKSVQENPFIPIAWQKDHKGMQGNEYIIDQKIINHKIGIWLKTRDESINRAKELNGNVQRARSFFDIQEIEDTGVTKQLCNRLLEPFMYHTVLLTATEFENFFNLRCPQYSPFNDDTEVFKSKKDCIKNLEEILPGLKDMIELEWLYMNKGQADIHMMDLAEKMWDAYNESTPQILKPGEWHIPFGDNIPENRILSEKFKVDLDGIREGQWVELDLSTDLPYKVKISTARCARLSYQTLGDNPKIDYEADLKLHDILLESGHFSPFEHCAKAMTQNEFEMYYKGKSTYLKASDGIFPYEAYGWCRNFKGFIQYRQLIDK